MAKSAAADAAADAATGTSAAESAKAAAQAAAGEAVAAGQAADQAEIDADNAENAAVSARAAATTSTAAANKSSAAARVADAAAATTRANAAQGDALAAEAINQAQVAKQNSDAANALAKQAAKDSADAKAAADGAKKEADGAVSDAATASGQAYAASQQAEIARDTANAVTAPADQAIELGITFAATDATAGLSVAVADTAKTLAEQEAAVADFRAAEAAAFAAAAQDAANRATGDAKLAAQAAADAAASAAKASRAAANALKSAAQAAADAKDTKAVSERLDAINLQTEGDAWKADQSAASAQNEAAAARAAATDSEKDAGAARTAATNARDSADDAASSAADAQKSADSAQQAANSAQADAKDSAQLAEGAAQFDRNPPSAGDHTPDNEFPGLTLEPIDMKQEAHATDQCKWNPEHPIHCSLPGDVHIWGKAMAFIVTCDIPNATAEACVATGKYTKDSLGPIDVDVTTHQVFDVNMWEQDVTFVKTLAYGMVSDFVGCVKHFDITSSDCLWAIGSIVIPAALKVALRAALTIRAAMVIGDMVGAEAAYNVLVQSAKAAAISMTTLSKFTDVLKAVRIRGLLKALLPCNPTHSFAAGTGVLMADGSVRPIQDVRGGDEVENARPGGGTERHRVENVFTTRTDTDFTDLTIGGPDGRQKITGTQNHPYYDLTRQAFVEASRLTVGDRLQTVDGSVATVLAVRSYVAAMVTYALGISDLHTYFVVAGRTPVLVHNFDCPVGVTVEATAEGITIAHPASGSMTIGLLDARTGTLTLGMDRLEGSTISGKQMFQMVMDHFGDKVEIIQGNWSYGDNLAAFNKLIAEGMPEKTAARATWTGQRAADYGYTSVRISRAEPAAEGGYARVSADFRKP
ncbi:Hint domain-containing protein [Kitasatospora sp. NPDC002227]|uniref:Hint domain-containing protein n=1 Tax=Kitasatospora sp. NPDC002227 TaxID=3154773 RepID=UPI00331B88FD